MPWLAVIPAAIGAGFAIDEALSTDTGDNPGYESKESKSRYANPMGAGKMGLAGIHGDWQKVGKVADSSRQGVLDQRRNASQSRGRQAGALDMLGQYASGEKSAARLAATNAIDQNQSAMASQAAAAGDSPAAQRAAMYGSASAGQNIAGTAATAAAKEQLGAQSAYLTGTGQMRAGDASQFGLESQYLQGNRAFALGQNAAQQQALGMGMNQVENERRGSMEYDKAVRNSLASQQQAETAERGQNISVMNNFVSAMAQGASAAAGKPGSDRSVKTAVSNARPEDVFGNANQALAQRDAASEAARLGTRFDPNWQDLWSEENQEVFGAGAGPYSQDEVEAGKRDMEDDEYRRRRTAILGQLQAAANANAQQVPESQLYSNAQLSDVPNPHFAQYEKVPTMQALNNLQGFDDRPVPGTWGNSTLNSIQQLVGSDEKVKQGVRGLSDEELSSEVARRNHGDPVGAMLDSIEAKKYRYKDPDSRGAAPGEQVGVMAQDLEQTPAGAALVSKDGPGGTRMVDYAKSGPLAFAALAQLNDRIAKLEKHGGGEGPGAPYEPVVARRFEPEIVGQTPYPPEYVGLSADEPGADARWGGMSPQGGPGAVQSALDDFRLAADTSAMRGQMGSDKLVKKGVSSLSNDELFSILGNRTQAMAELDRRFPQAQAQGGEDFSNAPLQVRGRGASPAPQGESSWLQPTRQPEAPIPVTQPGVAVMRGGVPVAGSNMGTAQWLANAQDEPTQVIMAANPEAAAYYAQQQRDAEEQRIAEYQMAAARGLPPPGAVAPTPAGPMTADGQVNFEYLADRSLGRR